MRAEALRSCHSRQTEANLLKKKQKGRAMKFGFVERKGKGIGGAQRNHSILQSRAARGAERFLRGNCGSRDQRSCAIGMGRGGFGIGGIVGPRAVERDRAGPRIQRDQVTLSMTLVKTTKGRLKEEQAAKYGWTGLREKRLAEICPLKKGVNGEESKQPRKRKLK